jgi:FHS family Na+ dependent glucose MFS transporter 1
MITGNLFGSFVASLIMTFYVHNAFAIWIGSAVLGMSYASIFPTVMTWMSENAKATGKATAVLITAGTVGDIFLPAVLGVMVAKVSPDSLIYFTFTGVIISAASASVMFLTACLQKRRVRSATQRRDIITVKYEKLTVDSNPRELEDEVELNDIGELSETCIIVNGDATVQADVGQ